MSEGVGRLFADITTLAPLYIPLGVIGLWRWGTWGVKIYLGRFYRPQQPSYVATVSVVTPVYNERPDVFSRALQSWQENNPAEIIAVIDHADATSIDVFRRFAESCPGARLLVTEKPGKRPALADGIRMARGEIVALTDSDTVWGSGVLASALAPFRDPHIGGVATRQHVLAPRTMAQRIFDMQLDQRYIDEMPFLCIGPGILRTLSGRTAFYRRAAVTPLLQDLEFETFLGHRVVSGDDKRLTYLVQAAGWKTTYQGNAVVYTPGMERLGTLWQQRLRWARNSWLQDLRVLGQRWVWHHPLFVLHLLDTFVQSLTVLISPITLGLVLALGEWRPALILVVWWHATRFIRVSPHLARRSRDLVLLSLFIVFSFCVGVLRIYALFSLNTHGWITRWDAERLPRVRMVQRLVPAVATILVLALLTGGIVAAGQGTSTGRRSPAVSRAAR